MVKINSEPAGAMAVSNVKSRKEQTYADGTISPYYGCAPTPCGVNLPRKSSPVIEISKPGYQSIKFKVTSAVATSATSVPTGAIVAGLQPGSQVVVGSPELLKRLPPGGMVIVGGLFSYGAGTVVDLASGANKSLTPNPVTAYLAAEEPDS
jgi:hypothetical protein